MTESSSPTESNSLLWRLGDAEFDFLRTEFRVAGQRVDLETHCVSVLICLIQADGQTVSRQQLLAAGWPRRDVPEFFLEQALAELRQALGAHTARYLEQSELGVRLAQPIQDAAVADAILAASKPPVTSAIRRELIFSLALLFAIAVISIFLLSRISDTAQPRAIRPRNVPVLAVLPLQNASLQADDNYLGEGIADEIINQLSSVNDVYVIARTSSFVFKDGSVTPREIAKQLQADYVLSGNLIQNHDQFVIELHLTRAIDGYEQWSYQNQDAVSQLLSDQAEWVKAIANELKISDFVVANESNSAAAFDLYLQARKQTRLGTENAYHKANQLYQRALELDPNYVTAMVGLAANYRRQAEIAQLPVEQGYQLAQQTIAKALAIKPSSAAALAESAWVEFNYLNDVERAAQHFKKALAANPHAFTILANVAIMLHDLDQADDALRLTQYIARYDPLNSRAHANLGLNYLSLGRINEAIQSFQTAIRLSPKRVISNYNLAVAYLLIGENQLAADTIKHETSDNFRLIGECLVDYSLGLSQADDKLKDLILRYEKDSAFNIAYVYAWRGETDLAFEWLQKAIEYRDPGLAEILVEPTLKKITSDPRWLTFLRHIKRDPDSLKTMQLDHLIPPTL